MAKFYGKVGYIITSETAPGTGIWADNVTEKTYSGDVVKESSSWRAGDNLNDDLNISNQISIVSDPFANQNFHAIKYVEWMGAKWKVTRVDVRFPRLLLTIGGVYNGN